MLASLALPDRAPAPGPAVLVLHEILGLNADIRRIAGMFADAGYVTLAPDLFEGRGPMPVCIVRALMSIAKDGGPIADDIMVARDWLAEREDVDADRIAVAGFCMGGSFVLLVTTTGAFACAAPFYGGVPREADRLLNSCPVVGGWGKKDHVFGSHGERLKSHLEHVGVAHDVKIYEEAGHSYMSKRDSAVLRIGGAGWPMHAAYNEEAARDSWDRMLRFFDQYLGATSPND